MITTAEVVTAVVSLAAAYCVGGLHGLLLAWTQPARMWRWAGFAHRHAMRLVEAEEKRIK